MSSSSLQWQSTASVSLFRRRLLHVALCLPVALRPGSSRGDRRRLYWTDSVDRAETVWGEGADQSPGKDGRQSGWAAAGEDPEGDRWAEEEWGWTGQTLPHWRPRPFPSGNTAQIDATTADFLSNFQDSNTNSNSLSLLVFQSCQSLHAPPVLSALPSVTVDPSLTFGPVMTAVSDFKGLLQEVCQGGFVCIYERGRYKRLYQISVFICHKLFCQLLFYMFSSFCPLQWEM